jgi:hypothetical protein
MTPQKPKSGEKKEPSQQDDLLSTPTMTRMQYRANLVAPVIPADSWAYIKQNKKREIGKRVWMVE